MIDPNLIGELQKDHQKLLLTKQEAAAFLGDLAALCRQHHVLLRTSDGMIRFSKSFEKSDTGFFQDPFGVFQKIHGAADHPAIRLGVEGRQA